MYMHLHSTSEKQIMYYDRDTTEGESAWREQIAAAVPASHNTIPCVVAEFSDGSLMYIGGVEQFVRKLGCPMKD
jgi:hypothetical protein